MADRAQAYEEQQHDVDLQAKREQQDVDLQAKRERYPDAYFPISMERDLNILVYDKPGLDKQTQWKICLPKSMVKDAVKWYHVALGHPGSTRTRETLLARYHSKHIRPECANFKCAHCKK